MDRIINNIKDKFGNTATIWQVKDDKNSFIIFENFAEAKGIYYNSKSGKSSKDFVDCLVLQETCDLIYKRWHNNA